MCIVALNKDQLQLLLWYEQGNTRVALRHGLSEQLMQQYLREQGYYDTVEQTQLAERMLAELHAEIIGYQIGCLDPIQSAVWLLLLSDKDKDKSNVAEQINTVCFDIAYNIKDLVNVDGTGLYQVDMTIVDETELDHDKITDYIDNRLVDLTYNESKLLELLSSPQSQPRAYYYGLIDMFRALD